jgi:hypothetical protein
MYSKRSSVHVHPAMSFRSRLNECSLPVMDSSLALTQMDHWIWVSLQADGKLLREATRNQGTTSLPRAAQPSR